MSATVLVLDREPTVLVATGHETVAAEVAYWKAFERTRVAWYWRMTRRVAREFLVEGAEMAALLARSPSAGTGLALLEQAVLQRHLPWRRLLFELYETVGVDVAARVGRGLKSAWAFETKGQQDLWLDTIREWLRRTAGVKITLITETTRRALMQTLSEGIAKGEGIPKLAQRLRVSYGEMSVTRSVTIARTETIAASNLGSRAAALHTGLELDHYWISTPDSRTRHWHRRAHGQRRPLHEPYVVGGERLLFPGDTSLGATAKNLVRCRCTEGYAPAMTPGV